MSSIQQVLNSVDLRRKIFNFKTEPKKEALELQVENSKKAYEEFLFVIKKVVFVEFMDRTLGEYDEHIFPVFWRNYCGWWRELDKYDKESFNYSEWGCSVGWCNKYCACKMDEDILYDSLK